MKLLMTLLVRDEQDILKENIEFHLSRGVDKIILMDNMSEDDTAEIARGYERGGHLHYIHQPQDDYSQGRWVTEMARLAAEDFGADWVINGDADEFWWPHSDSLKDVLGSLGTSATAVSVERTNFVPRPDGIEPFWQRMDVRRAVSRNCLGKPLANKIVHRALGDVTVQQGNHRVYFGGTAATGVAVPITILHFPIRSCAQFRNKIAKGGAAYARNTELDQSVGETWRYLYGLYLEGRFDDVYRQEVLSDEQIIGGLASGELIRDERLMRALEPEHLGEYAEGRREHASASREAPNIQERSGWLRQMAARVFSTRFSLPVVGR